MTEFLSKLSWGEIVILSVVLITISYIFTRLMSMAIFNSWSDMFYKCTKCAFYNKVKEMENVEKKEEELEVEKNKK